MVASKSVDNVAPVTQDKALALLSETFGSDSVEVLVEDTGLTVDFVERVEVFVGKYVSLKIVEQTREDTGEMYMTNLRSFEQVRSLNYGGRDETDADLSVIPAGTKRAVWGSYQIDEAFAEATNPDGSTRLPVVFGDIIAIQCTGKQDVGKGRTVRNFNVAVKRANP